jgi:hypothetical protein
MTGKGIFISYRRRDSAGRAGRIYDALVYRFGAERIFFDLDTIRPGDDFVQLIEKRISDAAIQILVIGTDWLEPGGSGRPRLFDEQDMVCAEIATALERGLHIIPVLVGEAEMPTADDLPESIAAICRLQAVELLDRHWRRDLDDLIEALVELVGEIYEDTPGGFRRLITDIVESVEQDDIAEAEALIAELELPDPVSWFTSTFGTEDGASVAQEYFKFSGSFVDEIMAVFSEVVSEGRTRIRVTVVDKPQSYDATGLQAAALVAALHPLRLYSVRFLEKGEKHGYHLWSFAYVDGGFRLLGKMGALKIRMPDRPR